jgi:hypothetical protein
MLFRSDRCRQRMGEWFRTVHGIWQLVRLPEGRQYYSRDFLILSHNVRVLSGGEDSRTSVVFVDQQPIA